MKKVIFFVAILAAVLACNSTSKMHSRKAIDWNLVSDIGYKAAKSLADHYTELRVKDFPLTVREINLSAETLKELAATSTELRLIMGADEKNNIILLLQRRETPAAVKKWYYLSDLFKDSQPGADGLPPLCGLEPALCTPIIRRSSVGSELSSSVALGMANSYFGKSAIDATTIISQINLEPTAILGMIGTNKNVKLIPAIGPDNKSTFLLELMAGTTVIYYNAKSKISDPVCPPPPQCALTAN